MEYDHKNYNKKYYAKTNETKTRNYEPWDPIEIELILNSDLPEMELARILKRSLHAIQLKRWRENKKRNGKEFY